MKSVVLTIVITLGSVSSSPSAQLVKSGAPSSVHLKDFKAAPWWDALRDEAFYRQCQSSCTEHSQGIKTTVELCDDREVKFNNNSSKHVRNRKVFKTSRTGRTWPFLFFRYILNTKIIWLILQGKMGNSIYQSALDLRPWKSPKPALDSMQTGIFF